MAGKAADNDNDLRKPRRDTIVSSPSMNGKYRNRDALMAQNRRPFNALSSRRASFNRGIRQPGIARP
jgi:hypothetical protein